MRFLASIVLLFLAGLMPGSFFAPVTAAYACGVETDCVMGDRTYRIRMPEGHDGKTRIGALVFMHGYKGSAAGTMRNANLARVADELGVALIAPKSAGNDWDLPGVPRNTKSTGENEFRYFEALIADVSKHFPIDTERLVATGFSAGGMMVWNLACHRGHLFAGFAPLSGTFWDPIPDTCPSAPVHLIHMHGTSDPVVPLAGRAIVDTSQGDVLEAMALFATAGGFERESPSDVLDLKCKRRTNADKRILELCLHAGGHRFSADYLLRAWEEFRKAGAL
ncbi:alpha/beta hydrolase family esterase [Coralliovum pocilloporae]|uniref:alpha/beta hydrolase family esterase n=1 Tax=Coralliovum pocilloporae TaxID=3066369 RepID=UPI00330766C2